MESFGARWESTRAFLTDYDVEVGQSAHFVKTTSGSVTEGLSAVYREGYGGRWREVPPGEIVPFWGGGFSPSFPELLELYDPKKALRGTVRIAGDTVFLDPGAASK